MEHTHAARTDAGKVAAIAPSLDDVIELAREIRITIEGTPPSYFLPPVIRAALPMLVRLADGLALLADQVKTCQVNQDGILKRLRMLEGTDGVHEFAAQLKRDGLIP